MTDIWLFRLLLGPSLTVLVKAGLATLREMC